MSEHASILPPNRTRLEAALEQALRKGDPDLSPIARLLNPTTCPAQLLGWLAWSFSVDVWGAEWPETRKRAVLSDAIEIHRHKGTKAAVRRALESIGFRTDISEWFEHGGAPHTFIIDAFAPDVYEAGFQIDQRLLNRVTRLIENVKPVRAQFDLRIGQSFDMGAAYRVGARAGKIAMGRIMPVVATHRPELTQAWRIGLRILKRNVLCPPAVSAQGAAYAR